MHIIIVRGHDGVVRARSFADFEIDMRIVEIDGVWHVFINDEYELLETYRCQDEAIDTLSAIVSSYNAELDRMWDIDFDQFKDNDIL